MLHGISTELEMWSLGVIGIGDMTQWRIVSVQPTDQLEKLVSSDPMKILDEVFA